MVEPKEVAIFGLISTILGVVVFVVTCSFDFIAGKLTWQHSEGLGMGQVIILATSGIYSLWAYTVGLRWREYLKKIHKLK